VQEKETTKSRDLTEVFGAPDTGRIVAIDVGTKRFGIAVCDDLQFTTRPVCNVKRYGWKKLLKEIINILEELDAKALVIGLPYNSDGTESEMSLDVRRIAQNFSLSLKIPVFLQDERVTSFEAKNLLYQQGFNPKEIVQRVDSEAAAIILSDFLDRKKKEEEKRRRGEKEQTNSI
jgi:putative Holliday junction resolvase